MNAVKFIHYIASVCVL